jgi:uncharacterized membrane-anchored protein YitT (DUF2179 family)
MLMPKKQWNKAEIKKSAKNIALITLGCFVLAAGTVAFLLPLDLVTGGVSGVSVILNHYLEPIFNTPIQDIIAWVIQVILLIVSFVFLGKKFTLHTIYATLLYPAFLTLLMRTHALDFISNAIKPENAGDLQIVYTLIAGIFGGAFSGAGVAITFLGDGSTGGFDVLAAIFAKYTPIKEGVSTFAVDAIIVIVGMICLRDIANGLIGILSALVCALVVQYVYVNSNRYVIADIISDKTSEIMAYVHAQMEHGTTVIECKGGFTGQDRKILRVAFNKKELNSFRSFLAVTDPRAFVSFTQASMINGEGFAPLVSNKKRKKDE